MVRRSQMYHKHLIILRSALIHPKERNEQRKKYDRGNINLKLCLYSHLPTRLHYFVVFFSLRFVLVSVLSFYVCLCLFLLLLTISLDLYYMIYHNMCCAYTTYIPRALLGRYYYFCYLRYAAKNHRRHSSARKYTHNIHRMFMVLIFFSLSVF